MSISVRLSANQRAFYVYVNNVLTKHKVNIGGKLMLMLVSLLSSLAHEASYAYVYVYAYACVEACITNHCFIRCSSLVSITSDFRLRLVKAWMGFEKKLEKQNCC